MRLKILFGAFLLGIVLFMVFIMTREPRSDRTWDTEVTYTATANLNADGSVTIKNVRDFTYGDGSVVSTDWLSEVHINPKDIVRAWFVLEPFSQWKAVGHTFLTVELADGSGYSFSVEARREKGEKYSAFLGLFRKCELAYTWGTERDFITRRLLYLKHPVRMYPLSIDAEGAQTLFTALIEKTNDVAEHPRFYNTLTANCTSVLADIANDITPGTIPYDISWNLPGSSDQFLARIGLIKVDGSLKDVEQQYDLTKERAQILDMATSSYSQFGTTLRSFLP